MTARSSGRRRATAWVAAVGFCLTGAHDARGDLREQIEQVAQAWRAQGATVALGESRFLNDDETIAIRLPRLPPGTCSSLVLLGARGLGFHVTFAPGSGDDAGTHLTSEGGVFSVQRCGDPPPQRILVTSDSGRGAIESVGARSPEALPPLRTILPERADGQVGPLADPGPLAPLSPPAQRADVAEQRAAWDGAVIGRRTTWLAGQDGAGAGEEALDPGCHSLSLFAVDPRTGHPARRGRVDLDAELRDINDDRLLARDRTDAPDAQLGICVGQSTHVGVLFAGAPPSTPVTATHVSWPLPAHLTPIWGDDARARMAHILLARHVAALPSDPILLAQGGAGETTIPIPIEPGACYLAIAVRLQGKAHTVGLRVHIGSHDAADDRGLDDDGAAVAFCAGGRRASSAQVEARGTPLLFWGLALYRLKNGIWESPR